ncbi:hypothetical protein BU14_0032s0010 [Porphyra umbilicalis]|uniref:Uncharacterized protein n=1 Tax=Porphyra umbilicalis TaxID=2786 RepID=A0A1X6PIR4_PORUM|nr:hypothetical protein BU14_0032s0010 [Porphyra umbilicalis]|eukprot:OSX80752.1 hypothetical protein BU14_0032s0010 [Porphyra umbilicalis]
MGAIKMLLVTAIVASLALLTVAASRPVAADDSADDMVDGAWPTGADDDVPADVVVIGGHTPLNEAPGLADITARQQVVAKKCFYFKCNTKRVRRVVRQAWRCFFKVAFKITPKPKPTGSLCHPTPYACTKSACGGWRRCLCDACKVVVFTYPVWCMKK